MELDNVLLVEGELKSMVAYIHLDSPYWQVVGIPGKKSYREVCEQFKGRKVWVLFDPDATEQAKDAARITNGNYIQFPMKVDDALNSGALNKEGLQRLIRMGRKI